MNLHAPTDGTGSAPSEQLGMGPSDSSAGPPPEPDKKTFRALKRLASSPAAFLLVSAFVTLTFVTIPRYTLATDVESAWSSVLDYAHATGLQFGTELVFPYG